MVFWLLDQGNRVLGGVAESQWKLKALLITNERVTRLIQIPLF